MSKRDVNDKSTYSFMRLGTQNYSHGKITLDNKCFTEGKEIECPECKHKFIWDKFFCLSPRYPKRWCDNPKKNTNNLPYGFQVTMEINTPSKGDPLPRISFIIHGCKLTIEDRVNESRPLDGVSFRSYNKQLTMEILDMEEEPEEKERVLKYENNTYR